ncbi:hypothetical protein [Singulisphaera sp. PoT]|uniref:hypothetical protein n=1 Tax=Singulisphaera sp. PoT TaxID=3411797 RepID=UPI003BF4DC51
MMGETPESSDKDQPDVADAGWLFESAPSPPKETPKTSQESAPDASDGYDLDLSDPVEVEPRKPSIPIPPPIPETGPSSSSADTSKARPEAKAKSKSSRAPAVVDQVWTRGAEWGSDLVRVGVVLLGAVVGAYVLASMGAYAFAFYLFLAGVVLAGVLSYPILVTLERPIRMTPEQAAQDFYSALSHLSPHYKRMWLLLSETGRIEGNFCSFDDFRDYWKARLAILNGNQAKRFNSLRFVVEDFRAEKSAGLTDVDGSYKVKVLTGDDSKGTLRNVATVSVEASFVRGPDRMWYLNEGKLPS